MTKEELQKLKDRFKNQVLASALPILLATPNNFEISKSTVSGYAISIYRIKPEEDFATYCYYKKEADRDADLKLLEEIGIG